MSNEHLEAVEAVGHEPGLVTGAGLLVVDGEGRLDTQQDQGEGGQLPGGRNKYKLHH